MFQRSLFPSSSLLQAKPFKFLGNVRTSNNTSPTCKQAIGISNLVPHRQTERGRVKTKQQVLTFSSSCGSSSKNKGSYASFNAHWEACVPGDDTRELQGRHGGTTARQWRVKDETRVEDRWKGQVCVVQKTQRRFVAIVLADWLCWVCTYHSQSCGCETARKGTKGTLNPSVPLTATVNRRGIRPLHRITTRLNLNAHFFGNKWDSHFKRTCPSKITVHKST